MILVNGWLDPSPRFHSYRCNMYVCMYVQAALLAGTGDYSIVLTPSYAAEPYNLYGWCVSYVQALWLLVPNCWYVIDGYGNYCFWLV